MVVAASVLLLLLLLYTLFAGYVPARQRAARLEAELKSLYAREAELHARLAEQEDSQGRERRVKALTAERDALARRVQELERELAAGRGRR